MWACMRHVSDERTDACAFMQACKRALAGVGQEMASDLAMYVCGTSCVQIVHAIDMCMARCVARRGVPLVAAMENALQAMTHRPPLVASMRRVVVRGV